MPHVQMLMKVSIGTMWHPAVQCPRNVLMRLVLLHKYNYARTNGTNGLTRSDQGLNARLIEVGELAVREWPNLNIAYLRASRDIARLAVKLFLLLLTEIMISYTKTVQVQDGHVPLRLHVPFHRVNRWQS